MCVYIYIYICIHTRDLLLLLLLVLVLEVTSLLFLGNLLEEAYIAMLDTGLLHTLRLLKDSPDHYNT